MRSHFSLGQYARGHLVGARATAMPLREQVEEALAQGVEVVFDFSAVEATQSFIDELVGVLVLRHGPDILDRLVFKSCSDDVRAIIEFVAADRCDQYIQSHSH
ncbi:MAG TPA: STAS-like domain-containing protein [Rugosibacter sp.]|nr:STAS-like domain-containing protein [Rugosibacter sp.]HPB91099.1 STAS-like domain-containing protein [Rugosibacter sp.]HQN46897.1 STAS-like domain-containing protein [Rugosibacter sp.]HQQ35635.1 STAS-like domain-containing protein [Rugosibacter sp.]